MTTVCLLYETYCVVPNMGTSVCLLRASCSSHVTEYKARLVY